MITYQREPVAGLWPEIEPLLIEHWREIAHYDDIELDVDKATYEQLDALGLLRVFTARVDGRLIGYAVYAVRRSLHYRKSLQALQDVLFLLPEYRGKAHGAGLIVFADQELQNEGVQVVYHHVKHKFDFGPLLASIGYESIEAVWGRRLD